VIVLSYNRWEKLAATLAALEREPGMAGAEVIVADNGSTDGTPEKLRERFPRVRVLAMAENRGVAAFNEGVRASGGEVVLILDDDAVPDAGAAEAALRVLAERADIGAVTLLPRHPATRASEWGFGEGLAGPDERWPVMGCANFVRREAWDAVGGYEESFFLYRNDTDLALKLLGAGWGVWFNPTLVAWHDSPASAAKSLRWFETATRNWVWVCRRHGRGASRTLGVLMGWLWAHRLAGGSAKAHGRVLKGMWQGLAKRPAPGPPSATHELARLLAARFQRKSSSRPRHSP
jgi:GT2 family glycosyltransferase